MISFDYETISNHDDVTYVGDLLADDEMATFSYVCPWTRPSGKPDRRLLKKLGDIVYFMYVNEELVKIGKAGGRGGMDSRLRTYAMNNAENNDRTNVMMLRVLSEMSERRIEIFAMQCPRQRVAFTNPLNESISYIDVETAKSMESELTAEAISQGYELVLCTQKQ